MGIVKEFLSRFLTSDCKYIIHVQVINLFPLCMRTTVIYSNNLMKCKPNQVLLFKNFLLVIT